MSKVYDLPAGADGVRELARCEEARWCALLAHAHELVIFLDQEGHVAQASSSVERALGLAPDALVGQAFAELSHPEDRPLVTAALEALVPGEAVTLSHRVKHEDHSWHSLESTLAWIPDPDRGGGVLVTSRDVTERVALEHDRERLELERRLSQRLEAVGQLAAGVAHEINTPLQFLGDSVRFLREAVDELLTLTGLYREMLCIETPLSQMQRQEVMDEAEEHADLDYLLERIPAAFGRTVEGLDRVTSIVAAMKRFAHPAGTEASAADLNEALDMTLTVCRNEYKHVAELELDLGELPPVTCNIGELNQVFLNLIVNAGQAIGEVVEGTDRLGRIAVSTRCAGEEAVIQIADDGPGIPDEIRDRIYDPFFTTKEVGKGTGQGLSLARATVEQHSGSLECASAVGEGTTFTIRLPIEPRGMMPTEVV